jgi:CDP-glucose 4,6-dehydratase
MARRQSTMESVVTLMNLSFFKDKTVLITGHTGFKGSWLCKVLSGAGANVIGYGLQPNTNPNLYHLCKIDTIVKSYIEDIRDLKTLLDVFQREQPEIVIHMAAQPLVRESYRDPVYTYETNVMGTVNVLECIRLTSSVKSVLNVTTDKVYYNNEWEWGYREHDILDGFEPYANSKSCSELVTNSYKRSFFLERKLPVSTARAGNVIGGGDFSVDRIIPDCVRSAQDKKDIFVRNPYSVRPYEHVLDPLSVYLEIIKKQYENFDFQSSYNVGPNDSDCITTGELADLFCKSWGNGITWHTGQQEGPHESSYLKLDCSKIKSALNWKPRWDIEKAVEKTVEWSKVFVANGDVITCMEEQISEFWNASYPMGV